MAFEDAYQTLAKTLDQHRRAFADALSGIDSGTDRLWYAQLLVNRLLLIYDLQVAGFLGQGDRWYLHSQLGYCQQRQPDSFYRQFWQPLCHQGLGLPVVERPLPVQSLLGQVPYLGCRLFQRHTLEQQYSALDVPDAPWEWCLGWLAEQTWQRDFASEVEPGTITRVTLAAAWESLTVGQTGKAIASSPVQLRATCDRTLDAYILQAWRSQRHDAIPAEPSIGQAKAPAEAEPRPVSSKPEAGGQFTSSTPDTLDALMANLDAPTCHLLVTAVLPELTLLDPACGSGRLLLMALERLQQLYRQCWNYAQQSSHPQLQAWMRSLKAQHPWPGWTIVSRIFTQNLYGVDLRPEATETTQCQLWLALLATATTAAELPVLTDLDFNITTGNALVGFVRVDEASFDKIVPKRSRQTTKVAPQAADQLTEKVNAQPDDEAAAIVLQGNLLQPLAAASYRDTLVEKQIRIEHYRAQSKAMAESGQIPEYVQTEFLRDRIDDLNQAAQQKLDRLLLETFSRKLGILVREPQPSGRTSKKLLTQTDIEVLQPFHWGFFFSGILEHRGGFDVVVTHAPPGTLRPSADAFYTRHAHRFQAAKIDRLTFRRSRKTVLKQLPELANLWASYAGQFAYLRDYFRRSDAYELPSPQTTRRAISLSMLFTQRCAALLSPRGLPPYLHDPGT